MVTGDNLDTATAIALDARILNEEEYDPDHLRADQKYTCMTGKQFRELIKLKKIYGTKPENKDKVVKEVLEDEGLFR